MVEFISKLVWQDIITLSSFIFGTLTLIVYLEQRKSVKKNQIY